MTRLLLLVALTISTITPAFAADNNLTGTLLVANRSGGSVSMYDLQTQTEIARLPIGPVIPHEMAASPDGRWAVTGEYGTGNNPGRHLLVIDVAAAEFVHRIDLGANTRPHSFWFLDDSRHVVATMERAEEIALVDIIDGEVVRTFPTGGNDSHMVRLSPDNEFAFVAARGSGTLSTIYLTEDLAPTVIPTGARAEGIAVDPDGSTVWVANQGDSTITVVDANNIEILHTISGIATNRVEFLPDGTAVIPGGCSDNDAVRCVTYFDGDTYEQIDQLELPATGGFGTGVRLLAADDKLFLADSALDEISAVDPATAGIRTVIAINPDNVDGMAWSPLRVSVMTD